MALKPSANIIPLFTHQVNTFRKKNRRFYSTVFLDFSLSIYLIRFRDYPERLLVHNNGFVFKILAMSVNTASYVRLVFAVNIAVVVKIDISQISHIVLL